MFSIGLSEGRSARPHLLWAAGLMLVQFGGIGAIHKHAITFQCFRTWPHALCYGLDGALLSIYGILTALALVGLFRPDLFAPLVAVRSARRWPVALNAAGLVIALAPTLLLQPGSGLDGVVPALLCWSVGSLMILSSAALWLAPAATWARFLAGSARWLVWTALAGAAVPLLANRVEQLWQLEEIAGRTFTAVVWTVSAFGYDIQSVPETRIIGSDSFMINVAPSCSGVEGIALVTLFTTLYLAMFRRDLRFPQALLLYPAGIALSLMFNVLRIALLIMIGLEGYPELAVGGFHSHAGWLMFTVVALGIVAAASAIPFLWRAEAQPGRARVASATPPPLREDAVAARILPFVVFMLTAAILPAISLTPGTLYPLRVLAVLAALAVFLPVYRRIAWRLDPWAVGGGLAIAVLWIAVPQPPAEGQPFGALAGLALAVWYVARAVGTSLVVPLVEELFFRDYLESRLRLGAGTGWAVAAAIASAIPFAALHDRWAEAFLAALIFSALARRGGIADAIVAHAVANAAIFAVAAATQDFTII